MASNQRTIAVVIKAIDQFSATMERFHKDTKQHMAAVQRSTEQTAKSFNQLKIAVGAVAGVIAGGAGMRSAWDWLGKTNADMEQAVISMNTLSGSTELAAETIKKLQIMATQTPFQFTELRQATVQLLAYKFNIEQVIPLLRVIGDASSGLGRGTEGVESITRALGQMQAKAVVSGEEMRQLAEMGVGAWDMLAEHYGKSVVEIMAMSEKRMLSASEAIPVIVEGMKKQFPDMMAVQARTFAGMMSNLSDYKEMAGLYLGRGLFDSVKPYLERLQNYLKEIINSGQLQQWGVSIGQGFQTAVMWGERLLPIMQGLVAQFVAMQAISLAKTIAPVFSSLVIYSQLIAGEMAVIPGILAKIATGASLTGSVLLSSFGWVGIAVAAVGALAAGYAYLSRWTKTVETDAEKYAKTINYLAGQHQWATTQINATSGSMATNSEAANANRYAVALQKDVLNKVAQQFGWTGEAVDMLTGKITANTAATRQNMLAQSYAAWGKFQQAKAAAEAYKAQFSRDEFENMDIVTGQLPSLQYQAMLDQAEAFNSEQKVVADSIDALDKQVSEGLSRYNDLQKKFSGGPTGGTGGGGSAGQSKSEAEREAKERAKQAKDAWKQALTDLMSTATEVSRNIGTRSEEEILSLQDTLEGMVETLREKVQEGIVDPAQVEKFAARITMAMTNLPAAINDSTGKTGQQVVSELYALADEFSDFADLAGSKIDRAFRGASQSVRKYMADMNAQLADAMNKLFELSSSQNEKLNQATADYQDQSAGVIKKMNADIKDAWDQYNEYVEGLKDKKNEWIGLFDEVPKASKQSMTKLLKNLFYQVQTFDQFKTSLGLLAQRGVDQGLIKELEQMGPKAAPQIKALANASDEELAEYVNLWKTRTEQIKVDSTEEIDKARQGVLEKEQKIRAEAQEQLDKIREDYNKTFSSIKKDTVDTIEEMIESLAQKYPELAKIVRAAAESMGLISPSAGASPTSFYNQFAQATADQVPIIDSSGQKVGWATMQDGHGYVNGKPILESYPNAAWIDMGNGARGYFLPGAGGATPGGQATGQNSGQNTGQPAAGTPGQAGSAAAQQTGNWWEQTAFYRAADKATSDDVPVTYPYDGTIVEWAKMVDGHGYLTRNGQQVPATEVYPNIVFIDYGSGNRAYWIPAGLEDGPGAVAPSWAIKEYQFHPDFLGSTAGVPGSSGGGGAVSGPTNTGGSSGSASAPSGGGSTSTRHSFMNRIASGEFSGQAVRSILDSYNYQYQWQQGGGAGSGRIVISGVGTINEGADFYIKGDRAYFFARGGVVDPSMGAAVPAVLHREEMVLPAELSTGIQDLIAGGYQGMNLGALVRAIEKLGDRLEAAIQDRMNIEFGQLLRIENYHAPQQSDEDRLVKNLAKEVVLASGRLY